MAVEMQLVQAVQAVGKGGARPAGPAPPIFFRFLVPGCVSAASACRSPVCSSVCGQLLLLSFSLPRRPPLPGLGWEKKKSHLLQRALPIGNCETIPVCRLKSNSFLAAIFLLLSWIPPSVPGLRGGLPAF